LDRNENIVNKGKQHIELSTYICRYCLGVSINKKRRRQIVWILVSTMPQVA